MAKPILKFPGGKRRIIKELTSRMPSKYERYFEPFFGGGALFFELSPKKAILSDINRELISFYECLKKNPKGLAATAKSMPYWGDDLKTTRKFYEHIRALDRSPAFKHLTLEYRAARILYLNKTSFNGLYRVNSKGQFNAPFGKYEKPRILDLKVLMECHESLCAKSVGVFSDDYKRAVSSAVVGDFVYFDPPYVPISSTANFTSYSADGFNLEEHKKLVSLCRRLDKEGVTFMLTNSDCDLTRKLYKGFRIESIVAPRSINRDGDGRKGRDIIVRNY